MPLRTRHRSRFASGNGSGKPFPDEGPATEALGGLLGHARQALEEIKALARVQLDLLKLSSRELGIKLGLGLVGLIAGGAGLITLVVFLLLGVAGGIAELLYGRAWAGFLIVGGVGLAGAIGGIVFTLRRMRARWFEQTVSRYPIEPEMPAVEEESP